MTLVKPQAEISPAVRRSDARTEEGADSRAADPAPTNGDVPFHLLTQDDLPCSDGENLETPQHGQNMYLLINTLEPWLRRRYEQTGDPKDGWFVGGNMFLYFSEEQTRGRHFRGPDLLVVLGVEPGVRKSWVKWQEGKAPDVVIELVSDTSVKVDKELKPQIYRDEIGVREYYWFDPYNPEDFAGFAFRDDERGSREPAILQPNLELDEDGRFTSEALGLRLGPWKGRFGGIDAIWLRWFTLEDELLLTEEGLQAAEQARRADQQARRADQQSRRADQLAAKLRALGVDPDELG